MTGDVALVTEIAAPYRIPVFNELARLLDGHLHVFFISESEGRRDWSLDPGAARFRYTILPSLQFTVPLRGDRQPVYLAAPLVGYLARRRFERILVGGWNHLECYWALEYARARSIPFVLWSETPLIGARPRRMVRDALKRHVIRGSASFVVPGPSARAYLESLGADGARIHEAPNAVDVDFWSCSTAARRRTGPTLLYSGRLVNSKGLGIAFEAFAQSRLAGKWRFLVAGDGPEAGALARSAPAGVELLGPTDALTLRDLYHSADMLVLPSLYDPWGLVINEAACAGLAVVASDGAGAARDLLRDGENGLVFRAGDVNGLRAAFDRLADDPSLARRLGEAAAQIAVTHTPSACAAGIASAVR